MADEREQWAKAAREREQPDSAKEFELTALLLRFYALFCGPDVRR
jgi:hypothetical protein